MCVSSDSVNVGVTSADRVSVDVMSFVLLSGGRTRALVRAFVAPEADLTAPRVAERRVAGVELLPRTLLPEHRGTHRHRLVEVRRRLVDHHVDARHGTAHRRVAAVDAE